MAGAKLGIPMDVTLPWSFLLCCNYGLRTLSSSTAVALMNLVPIFGVLFSTVFLHEVLRIFDLFGGIIIILGAYLRVREKQT